MRKAKEKCSGRNFEQIKLFTFEEETMSSEPKKGKYEGKVREEVESGCPCYFGICSECEEYKESQEKLRNSLGKDIVKNGIF